MRSKIKIPNTLFYVHFKGSKDYLKQKFVFILKLILALPLKFIRVMVMSFKTFLYLW